MMYLKKIMHFSVIDIFKIVIAFRFAIHWRIEVETRKVPEAWAIFDFPAAFNSVGIDLFQAVNPIVN